MAIYLIDYENTQNLSGIAKLNSEDRVIIFHSQKSNTLTFDIHKEILNSKANIEYKFVEAGGQNALDFQLSTYLGYLINTKETCKYFIVSKDKGYTFVTSFWQKEKSIQIQIISDLIGKIEKQTSENSEIENLLKQSNIELTKEEIQQVIAMVAKYKTTQTINGYLNKMFKDSTKAGNVLKIIKPYIKK